MMVMAIFKRIQLFIFAFSIAMSGMISLGVLSGKIDRTQLIVAITERMTGHLTQNPDQMNYIVSLYAKLRYAFTFSDEEKTSRANRPNRSAELPNTQSKGSKNTIAELQARQRKDN